MKEKCFQIQNLVKEEKEVLIPASKPTNAIGFTGFTLPTNPTTSLGTNQTKSSDTVDAALSLTQRNPSIFPIYDKFNYQCHKPRMEYQIRKYDLSYYQKYCNRFLTFQSGLNHIQSDLINSPELDSYIQEETK